MEECGELAQQCSKTIRKFDTIEQALEDTEAAVRNRTKLLEDCLLYTSDAADE